MKRTCEKCGSCCLQYKEIHGIIEEDIRRWVNESRTDIMQYCYGWNDKCHMLGDEEKLIRYLTKPKMNMEMWCNPENREENIKLCPFLRKKYGKNKFECMIHETKPEVCSNYMCIQRDMKGIVKKSFGSNLREYRRKRKKYRSFKKTSPFIGNPLKRTLPSLRN